MIISIKRNNWNKSR